MRQKKFYDHELALHSRTVQRRVLLVVGDSGVDAAVQQMADDVRVAAFSCKMKSSAAL